jgi:hypothetical protein
MIFKSENETNMAVFVTNGNMDEYFEKIELVSELVSNDDVWYFMEDFLNDLWNTSSTSWDFWMPVNGLIYNAINENDRI